MDDPRLKGFVSKVAIRKTPPKQESRREELCAKCPLHYEILANKSGPFDSDLFHGFYKFI